MQLDMLVDSYVASEKVSCTVQEDDYTKGRPVCRMFIKHGL